jgi:hypothetical protein
MKEAKYYNKEQADHCDLTFKVLPNLLLSLSYACSSSLFKYFFGKQTTSYQGQARVDR